MTKDEAIKLAIQVGGLPLPTAPEFLVKFANAVAEYVKQKEPHAPATTD